MIVLRFAPGPPETCSFEVEMSTFAFELTEPVDTDAPPPVAYICDDGRNATRAVP